MVKFKTHYNASEFPKVYDKTGGEKMVETAGYISAKQRIENMILAGQRLNAYREEMYDINGEKYADPNFDPDELPIDPTRSGNYDLADAFQQGLQVSNSIRDRQRQTVKTEKVDDVQMPVSKGSGKSPAVGDESAE